MTCKILKFVSIKFRDADLNSHWQLMLFRGYKISQVFVKFSRILVKFAKCYTHEIQYEVLTDFIFRPMIFLRWWNFIKEIIHHVETGRHLKIKLLLQMKTVQCKKWDWWIIGELPRLLFLWPSYHKNMTAKLVSNVTWQQTCTKFLIWKSSPFFC